MARDDNDDLAQGLGPGDGTHREPAQERDPKPNPAHLYDLYAGYDESYSAYDASHGHDLSHHGQTSMLHALPQVALDRLRAIGEATLHAIRRHWLAGVNVLLGTLIGIAVLTPIGYALGLTGPSDVVFHAYRFICGQTPSHTFYIAGYQMCLCTRCLAIYSSLLTGGLLLALLRHAQTLQIRGLSWMFWLLAMLPMALDGGTQLFGLRESNLALRLLTGALFGLATAWFLFPQIEVASREVSPVVYRYDGPAGYGDYDGPNGSPMPRES